jgi:prevent-host-death family protein
MATVNVRELRNHGGEVLERVIAGETITVSKSGQDVAELRPIPRRGVSSEELLRRWKRLPRIEPAALRADIDSIFDTSL